MNKLFKKAKRKEYNVGWAFSPTLKYCWGRNPNHLQKAISSTSRKATRDVKGDLVPAFTLAEVLITLGVIGVVAALTLPTLIQNYQKHVAINRLKHAYSVLSNTFLRAEADYGPITQWGLADSAWKEYETNNVLSDIQLFAEKYMRPYLIGTEYKFCTIKDWGYKTPIKKMDGSIYSSLTGRLPGFRLNNGTIVFMNVTNFTTTGPNGEKYLAEYDFYIDIDGPNGQNTFGKDIYAAMLPFANNTRFLFKQTFQLNKGENIMRLDNYTREQTLGNCKTYGSMCGTLIQQDGWQMKEDYPW